MKYKKRNSRVPRRAAIPLGVSVEVAPDGSRCLSLSFPDGSAYLLDGETALAYGLACISRAKALFDSEAALNAAVTAAQEKLRLLTGGPGATVQ